MIKRIRYVFCVAVLAFCASLATAQETQQLTVPLTDPGKPLSLHVSLLSGSLAVEGYDGAEVRIEVTSEAVDTSDEIVQGMRRIPNSSLGLSVEEEGNHVSIEGNWSSRISALRVQVPRQASAELSCVNGGDITVDGLSGELELTNTNGGISATGVSGSVMASTTNGDVRVTFEAIEQDKAMSFITFHGDVDVTFPSGLSADLRLSAGQGDIFTDFDFDVVPQQVQVDDRREGGRYRIDMNQAVFARIGGGGPEMHFKTWSGNVFIRRK